MKQKTRCKNIGIGLKKAVSVDLYFYQSEYPSCNCFRTTIKIVLAQKALLLNSYWPTAADRLTRFIVQCRPTRKMQN